MEGSYQWDSAADSADNTTLTRTFAATASRRHWIGKVRLSYDAKPGGDTYLTVAWTRKGVAKSDVIGITAEGPMEFDFTGEVIGDPNTEVVLSMTASGAAGNLAKMTTKFRTVP